MATLFGLQVVGQVVVAFSPPRPSINGAWVCKRGSCLGRGVVLSSRTVENDQKYLLLLSPPRPVCALIPRGLFLTSFPLSTVARLRSHFLRVLLASGAVVRISDHSHLHLLLHLLLLINLIHTATICTLSITIHYFYSDYSTVLCTSILLCSLSLFRPHPPSLVWFRWTTTHP